MANNINTLPSGTILHGIYRIDNLLNTYCDDVSFNYMATNLNSNMKVIIKEFFILNWSQRDGETRHVKCFEYVEVHKHFCAYFYKIYKELSQINSPHFAKVCDVFEENGTCYCAVLHFDGESFLDLMHQYKTPFDSNWLLESFLPQALDGIEAIHEKKLLHLQVRPIDIRITPNGNVLFWQYCNISKLLFTYCSNEDSIFNQDAYKKIEGYLYPIGRVRFNAVELKAFCYDRIGPWTDLYSLGATLYNLATKQMPPSQSQINVEIMDAFHFLSGTNETFKKLVIWMMNVNISKRPQTVQDIRDFLKNSD